MDLGSSSIILGNVELCLSLFELFNGLLLYLYQTTSVVLSDFISLIIS